MFEQFDNWRGEHPRARRRRSSALHLRFQKISVLLDINGVVPNRSHKSIADLLPMKDLAGIECHGEIEIGGADFSKRHCDFVPSIQHPAFSIDYEQEHEQE